MTNKLLIIDGHNLLFQMFYGMPARIVNSKGKPIHAVVGFVGALIKMIDMTACTHIVVLFDKEQPNQRAEILPDYKSNRQDFSKIDQQDNPFSQLEDIYKALDYMGIQHTEVENEEVDDTIASYVLTYHYTTSITIASFDSDFFQLIKENVTILRYRGKSSVFCDSDYVKNRFGIEPSQYADFKALVGDAADVIKGIPKIGVKTASSLLNQYQNIEGIVRKINVLKPAIRNSLEENIETLKLNYQLICLNKIGKLLFTIKELFLHTKEYKTKDILYKIY